MVLTDTDIRKLIRTGTIKITDFDEKKLGSNSYDLSLGNTLMVYTGMELDSRKPNETVMFEIPKEEGFLLKPGELYLGVTKEETYSKDHVPCIEGKSSVGRLGISVHVTAGFGDVGFRGYWTLEMTVVKPVWVYAGMPIAQIYFMMTLSTCGRPYYMKKDAKYHNQPGYPVASMMYKNFEKAEID